VDRWITANVSSCIDFYGIDKLINTEVAIITCSNGIIGLVMRNSLLNKIAASYTKRNTRPLTVSNNKKISNDNFRVVTT
jgi:hypothetical protein